MPDFLALADLRTYREVSQLELSHVGEEGLEALSGMLAGLPALRSLSLRTINPRINLALLLLPEQLISFSVSGILLTGLPRQAGAAGATPDGEARPCLMEFNIAGNSWPMQDLANLFLAYPQLHSLSLELKEISQETEAAFPSLPPGVKTLGIKKLDQRAWEPEDFRYLEQLSLEQIGLPNGVDAYFQLPELVHIHIRNCKIRQVQLDGAVGKKLKELSLIACRMNMFQVKSPEAFPVLKRINMRNNNLWQFEVATGAMPGLSEIRLKVNSLPAIPDCMRQFKSLEILEINQNSLDTIPDFLGALPKLESLDVTNNKLTALPENFSDCKNLHALYLGKNRFQQFPSVLFEMPWLKNVGLKGNTFRKESGYNIARKMEQFFTDGLAGVIGAEDRDWYLKLLWGDLEGASKACEPEHLWQILFQDDQEISAYASAVLREKIPLPELPTPERIYWHGELMFLDEEEVKARCEKLGIAFTEGLAPDRKWQFMGINNHWIPEFDPGYEPLLGEAHLRDLLILWEESQRKVLSPASEKNLHRLIESNNREHILLALNLLKAVDFQPQLLSRLVGLLLFHHDPSVNAASREVLIRFAPFSLVVFLEMEFTDYNWQKTSHFWKFLRYLTDHPFLDRNVIIASAQSSGNRDLVEYIEHNMLTPTVLAEKVQGNRLRLGRYQIGNAELNITLPEGVDAVALDHTWLEESNLEIEPAEQIRDLDLSFNHLKEAPAFVRKMQYLESLDLSGNPLQKIPEWLFRDLPHLRTLRLGHSSLDVLPGNIWELKALESLELESSKVGNLPETAVMPAGIRRLVLRDTRLDTLPDWLGQEGGHLDYLDVSELSLTDFPGPLAKLDAIGELSIRELTVLDATDPQNLELDPESLLGLPQVDDLKMAATGGDVQVSDPGQLRLQPRALTFQRYTWFAFPRWVFHQDSLKALYFDGILESLDGDWGKLSQLQTLELRLKNTTTLPESWLGSPPPALKKLALGLYAGEEIEIISPDSLLRILPAVSSLRECLLPARFKANEALLKALEGKMPACSFR